MLCAWIAQNRCWRSKSVSLAQIGSGRRGAWGFCGSMQVTHAPQSHHLRLKADLRPFTVFEQFWLAVSCLDSVVWRRVRCGANRNPMGNMRVHRPSAVAAALLLTLSVQAADQSSTNSATGEVLLLDRLGRVVKVPTNEMPAGFLPPRAPRLRPCHRGLACAARRRHRYRRRATPF